MPVSLNERIAHPLASKLSLKSLRDNDLGLGVSNPYAQDVFNILSKFGSDAHLFMPGPGVPVLGPEIVDFSTLSAGAGITITPATRSISFNGSQPDWGGLVTTIQLNPLKSYLLSYTISRTSGMVKVTVGPEGYDNASGNYTKTQAGTGYFNVQSYSAPEKFVGTVSNISVKEVLGYTNYLNGFAAGNYLESTGNTNASVDGAVGLVLDAAGSVGPELMPAGTAGAVIGAPGALPNGWQGGVTVNGITRQVVGIGSNYVDLRLTGTATSTWADYVGVIGTTVSVTPGETYRIEMPETPVVGGTMPSGGGITYGCATQLSGTFVGTQMGRFQHITIPTGVNQLRLFNTIANYANGATVDVTLRVYSTVSVKKVTGTHATQATTANKPILRRGIVNQLLWSGDLTNGAWTKSASAVTPAGESTPLGSSGQLLTSSGAFASAYPSAPISAVAGQVVTMAFEIKAGNGAATATLVDESQGGTCYSQVTLSNGATGSTGFVTSSGSVDLGNGWFLATATYTVQSGKTSVLPKLWVGVYNAADTTGQSIKVGRVGLFQGAITAAQIIAAGGIPLTTTAPASSQYGIGEPVLGPELVVNGDFSAGSSGWTLTGGASVTGGKVVISGVSTCKQSIPTVANARYQLRFDATKTSDTIQVWANGVQLWNSFSGGVGSKLYEFTATASSTLIEYNGGDASASGTGDNISVKEITGYKSLPNSYAWQFDGADDSLSLQGALFQIADDHCVVAAGVASIDASARVMFAQGAVGQSSRVPTVYNASGVATVGWRDNSGAGPNINAGTLAQNQPFVIAARKVGSTVMARLNGGATVSATNQTWGVTTCNAATIGALPVGGATWNSLLYPMIIIKGTVSEAEEKAMVKLLGSIAGVSIA